MSSRDLSSSGSFNRTTPRNHIRRSRKRREGGPVQGLTVTMTRTKYNLNPQVVTVEQTTTNAQGHYEFTTWSRCSVVEDFRASYGTYLFVGGTSVSGCVIQT